MSSQHQKLFQHAFEIKIKKIKVINMVSIKKILILLKYLPFLSKHLTNKKSRKLPNNLPNW